MNFKKYESPTLNLGDAIAILTEVNSMGLEVQQEQDNVFVMEIDGRRQIRVACGPTSAQVQGNVGQFPNYVENVTSKEALLESIRVIFLKMTGKELGKSPPQSFRLKQSEPATNFAKLANLIGTQKIIAVFDPFLDNAGLQTLLDITALKKASISPEVRLLTSVKGLEKERLTETYVKLWCKQTGAAYSQLKVLSSKDEHRRFLTLDNKLSLVLGCSLNNLEKNEVAFIENSPEDCKFFDECWHTAKTLTI